MSGNNGATQDHLRLWQRLILAVGVLLPIFAVSKAVTAMTSSGGLLEAGLDLALLSVPGLVLLHIGLWLPSSTIEPKFYPRIVAWGVGGVVVVGIVL